MDDIVDTDRQQQAEPPQGNLNSQNIENDDDFWKEKDQTFYDNKRDIDQSENDQKNVSQDDQISRKTTFSVTELAKKREWIKKMKKTLQDSQKEHYIGTSPGSKKGKRKSIFGLTSR